MLAQGMALILSDTLGTDQHEEAQPTVPHRSRDV
jgi:hypothetical protein